MHTVLITHILTTLGMARRKISLEVDETSESSANDTMVIIIASAVSGGILVIVILSIVVVCYLLRKRRKAEENAIKTELSDGNPTNGTRVVYESPVNTEEYESEIDDDEDGDCFTKRRMSRSRLLKVGK